MPRSALLLALLLAGIGLLAPVAHGLEEVSIPETPAGAALTGWLEVVRSGDKERLESHFETGFEEDFREEVPAPQYLALSTPIGPLLSSATLARIDAPAPHRLTAWYQAGTVWLEIRLEVQRRKPHLISGLLIQPTAPPDDEGDQDPEWSNLSELLEIVRKDASLPALAAAHVKDGKIVDRAVVGVRTVGEEEAAAINDLWHIGSITKSMTAVLVARLIEKKRLRWDLTVAEALPDMEMLPVYRNVTLEQLLRHRGGIPAETNFDEATGKRLQSLPGTPAEQRATYQKAPPLAQRVGRHLLRPRISLSGPERGDRHGDQHRPRRRPGRGEDRARAPKEVPLTPSGPGLAFPPRARGVGAPSLARPPSCTQPRTDHAMGSIDTSKKATDFLSWKLASWASSLKYEHLSKEAIHAAKLFLYDSIGCALGGSQQDDVRIAIDHFQEMGGARTCRVLASGFKTNPVDAAFLNALMVRAMDYNDIYWKADPSHPSDIIPGPMALVEMLGSGGKKLILGVVIAYEMEMRLCEFGEPGIREYGWHHATLTSIASPIACGRVLGLKPDKIQQAIGISASPSMCLGAVTAGKLTNMKNTVDPLATRSGVQAVLLARRGFSGPEHVLDGKESLAHCFGKFGGKFHLDMLTDKLPTGKDHHYKIVDCGMKSFPIEALGHAPLTALMKIRKEHDLAPDDVTEIKVEVIARAADILGDPAKYRPTSKETADHSLPYSLAVGLVDGMVTPLQFKQERIADKALHPVMDKIKVVPNQEFESLFPKFQPSQVTVTLKSGASHTQRVDVPKGDPRDPMTEEEIAVKFNALGQDVIGKKKCDKLRSIIMSIEKEKTLDQLFSLARA